MIFRNIQIAIRKLRANISFFIINFLGLILALSILAVTGAYVYHELSFDIHVPDREHVYLVSTDYDDGKTLYRTAEGLSQALAAEIPGVEAAGSIWSFSSYGFYEHEDKVFSTKTASVTHDFFQTFPADVLHGGKLKNLKPHEIVITASAAEKIFGQLDVVGKSLTQKDDLGYTESYLIKAVVKDSPTHASIVVDAYINGGEPRALSKGLLIFNWIKKNKTTSIDQIEENLDSFYNKSGFQEDQSIKFIALSKLHFNDDPELQALFNSRSPKMLYTLICISALTILISGFNYINLTTAKYQSELKEIGVRRTLGATNQQLIMQLASEAAFHFLVALPIAYLLAILVFPKFTDLIAVDIPEGFLLNVKVFLIVAGITLAIAGLCGWYPSYGLIKYKTTQLLTQKGAKPYALSLRKSNATSGNRLPGFS